jgi:glycosyltransferase involved in cell wall biosynthesis
VLRKLNARRIRRAEPADIVHHTFYQPEAFELWPGQRHITTVYDFIIERFPELLAPGDDHIARHTEVIQRADALICISETTREDLHRFHPDYDKPVFTVPLGVGPSFFDPAPTKLPALPERYVLYVGNRTAHKNINLLLEGYAEISKLHPDVHLVLVGAPAPTEADKISELGIESKTTKLRVSDAVLPWIYRKASVMMYGSLWEGFGLPVVESMASGCPAIIEDIPALTEVGGDAALVFAPNDRDTLVSHLERVLTDPVEAQRLRAAGLDRARLFTWRRTAELTAKVYEQIADV